MNLLHLVSRETGPLPPKLEKLVRLSETEASTFPSSIIVQKDKADLKNRLTPLQYQVTQLKHTERPFSGALVREQSPGAYVCVVCNAFLFHSRHKFKSESGWPAFSDVSRSTSVRLTRDCSMGMNRVEVSCGQCNSHLGHLFDDGPKPTGLRYCINSASLAFHAELKPEEKKPVKATSL